MIHTNNYLLGYGADDILNKIKEKKGESTSLKRQTQKLCPGTK